ncbi:MAG: proton-conducting transporter membrane subunit [Gammaproteobacteria bacterium]
MSAALVTTGWQTALLIACVLAPLVLALALTVPRARTAVAALLPWAALPALLLALLSGGVPTVEIPWLLLGSLIGLDAIGRLFLLFTALLWLIAGLVLHGGRGRSTLPAGVAAAWLLTLAGNLWLILAQDVASLYLAFALMTFAAYGLVVQRGDSAARRAGRVYMVFTIVGEVLLFTGLVMAVAVTGVHALEALPAALAAAAQRDAILALLIAGFGIKAGLLTLHLWMPRVYPVLSAPAAAVVGGALIHAGLLGWLRVLPIGEVAAPEWGMLLMTLGLAAAFYGVLVGLTQDDPKTVLAYSSLSQMGYLAWGVGAALYLPVLAPVAVTALLIFATHHALAKGALFLIVGLAEAGAPRARRLALAAAALPALALAGAPFTSGAYAKLALKPVVAALPEPWPGALAVLLPLAAVGTTLLMARFLVALAAQPATGANAWRDTGVYLALLLLVIAVWPYAADPSARGWAFGPTLAALWPVALGAVAAGFGWRLRARLPRLRVPPGDLLVPLASLGQAVARRVRGWPLSPPRVPIEPVPPSPRERHRLAAAERAMARWSLAGPVWLALVLLLIGLLAVG